MFKTISLLSIPVALLFSFSLAAQTPEPNLKRGFGGDQKPTGKKDDKAGQKPKKTTRKVDEKTGKKVIDRLQENRRRIVRDRLKASNVMVVVLLTNRQRITGIVRHGRFVEKSVLGGYMLAKKDEKGAGIRLFYYNNTSSVMFIPYSSIAKLLRKNRMTDLEVEARAKSIRQKKAVNVEAAKKKAKARIAKIKARNEAKKKLKKSMTDALEALKKQQRETEKKISQAELLKEFPLSGGWSADRVTRISQNKVNGIMPTKKEIRFLTVFSKWLEALEASKKTDKPTPEAKPETGRK